MYFISFVRRSYDTTERGESASLSGKSKSDKHNSHMTRNETKRNQIRVIMVDGQRSHATVSPMPSRF